MKKAREPQEKATRGADRRIAAKKSEAKTKRPPPAPAGPDFASFFEHVSGVLFCIAIEPRGRFRFLAVNEAFLEATGLRREQVASKLVGDVIPEPSLSIVLKKYREAIRKRQTVRWEETSVYPTGTKHGEVAITPKFDARGRATHLFGIVFDTTERKKAEEALQDAERGFKAVFAQGAVGMAMVDSESGRFIDVNQRACAIARLSREQMLDTSWRLLCHPEDNLRDEALMAKLRAGEIDHFSLEKRYLHADGSTTWVNLTVFPAWKPGEKPLCHIAVVDDITVRKVAEQRYQREREFIETLVNLTSAIILLLDRGGRMVYVNDATLRLLGYLRSDLIGRTPWGAGLMDAAETARSKARLARLVAGETNPPREAVLRGKDGRRHYVELTSISTRTTDNEPDRIIVTGTDLTEHHHLQREILRISEQEQARLGHNLHDGIGQTMTGIAALMESLEGELDGAPRETAARIRELVRDAILEVRQMSHGLSPTAVRNRGLPGALHLLAETIRLNHRTACELAADPAIRLDNTERETHVYRIAQEAANNALRHGKPRKIKITLRREGEDECVMEISDDGTGISRQTADRPGGIGLRVMDYRANCLKGTLEVKSARGRGTTVTCRFPIQDPAARDESAASAAHESHAEAEIARDI